MEHYQNQQRNTELKKQAFILANETLIRERQLRDDLIKEETATKLDYFPFTHGDSVENHRKVLIDL